MTINRNHFSPRFLPLSLVIACMMVTLCESTISGAPPEEVGYISQPKGEVLLWRPGKRPQPVKLTLTKLYVGDKVTTGADGEATIYQVYAAVIRLRPNKCKKIIRLSPPPPKDGLTRQEFDAFQRLYATSVSNYGKKPRPTMGDSSEQALTLISPRFSTVLEPRPEFVWTEVRQTSEYEVKVYDQQGRELWSARSPTNKISYTGRQPLSDGNYKWDVTALVEGRITPEQSKFDAAPFTIKAKTGDAIRKNLSRTLQIVSDEEIVNLPYIGLLFKYRIYPQAEIELKKALALSSEDDTLWTLLIENYRLAERWRDRKKIVEERKKAKSKAPTDHRPRPR